MQILLSRLKFFTLALFAAMLIACGGGGEGTNPIGGGTGGDTGGDDGGDVGGDDGDVSGDGFSLSIRLYEDDVSISGFVAGSLPDTNTISSVSSVEGGVVAVGVVDSDGAPVPNSIVTVTATSGNLTPANGFVLTNSNGVAAATFDAGDAQSGSAGVLSADLQGFAASVNYSIGSVDLKLGRDSNADGNAATYSSADYVDGEISVLSENLSATGSTQLQVVVVDSSDNLFLSPVTVNFTSACAVSGDASIDTGITSVGGMVAATYTANGCEGEDQITASIEEVSGVNASGSVQIETAEISSIQFVSADPQNIALKGTGGAGRAELSTLTFRVIDDTGSGVQGQTVSFELSTDVGGVEFTGAGGITTSADTNATGFVSVGVQSGSVPTGVTVEATLDHDSDPLTPEISTFSDTLVVSTGLPDNNSFSLSASILNPGGHQVDGIISDINIRAADKFNNPVPDGTVINFTTEYGRVEDSCNTVDGGCSVEWNSQDPRFPNLAATGNVLTLSDRACDTDNDGFVRDDGTDIPGYPCVHTLIDTSEGLPFDLSDGGLDGNIFAGEIFGGRTTILAYAVGEETFTDANSNGVFDAGENHVDLAEAYIDHNEDFVFGNDITDGGCESETDTDTAGIDCSNWRPGGAEEEFVDFSNEGSYTSGNGIYNGSLCSDAAEAANACTKELVNVRDSVVLVAGGSTPHIGIYRADNVLLSAGSPGSSINVDLTDDDLADPADNTRVVVVSDLFNGTLPAGTTIDIEAENCEILSIDSYEIADTNAKGNAQFDIVLGPDTNTTAVDAVTITVTPPDSSGGAPVQAAFSCTDI